jgi:hypothetical protein
MSVPSDPAVPIKAAPSLPEFANAPFALMMAIVFIFAGVLVILAYHEIPEKNQGIVTALAGGLGSAVTTIIGFYFGSSKGSQNKDVVISSELKGTNP